MPASVKGAVALRKSLRAFAPDLAKETQKEIAGALKPITKTAKGYLPDDGQVLSGWLARENSQARFPSYNARIVKAGVGYKTSPSKPNRRGFRSLARVFNKSAAGAIYETMGRKTPQSRFVQNQQSKYSSQMKGDQKMEGRALFRAYEENNGKAREAVLSAIKNAANKLNARAKV
jgi:gas vesicle protein